MSKATEGEIKVLEGFPQDVVAFELVGRIDSDDYETVLIPEIEARVKQEGKVKVLIVIGKAYKGVSAGAAWEDLKFGLLHLGDFPRIAVVTNRKGLRKALKLFAPLMRSEVGAFRLKDLEKAKAWIADNTAPLEADEAESEARRKMQAEQEVILPIEQ